MRLLFVTNSRADRPKMFPLMEAARARHAVEHADVEKCGPCPELECARFDAVIVHGDRVEALGTATAATIAGTKLVHVEAGEHSGSVDNAIRWAISRLATAFAVCSEDARRCLLDSGEEAARIEVVGSPERRGPMPSRIVPETPYGIAIVHSVPTSKDETDALNAAFSSFLSSPPIPFYVFEPNADRYRERLSFAHDSIASLPHADFAKLLAGASVIIGNSSCVVREAPWYGVPAVLVGSRQRARAIRGSAVLQAQPVESEIRRAVGIALGGRFWYSHEERTHFGDGNPGPRFLDLLDRLPSLEFEKRYR